MDEVVVARVVVGTRVDVVVCALAPADVFDSSSLFTVGMGTVVVVDLVVVVVKVRVKRGGHVPHVSGQ